MLVFNLPRKSTRDKAGPGNVRPDVLPFVAPGQVDDELTALRAFCLLSNIADVRGPNAERIRRRCRRKLRAAGWDVRRLRKPEGAGAGR